jgi:hypothetical protein
VAVERVRAPRREEGALGRPGRREDEALGEQLADHVAARGAHRHADGQLAPPPLAAREEEPRRVGARHHQHERGGAEQQAVEAPRGPAGAGLEQRVHGREDERVRVLLPLRLARRPTLRDDVELGLCLRDPHSGPEPPDDVEPRHPPRLERGLAGDLGVDERLLHDRDPELRDALEVHPHEAAGENADHGERMAVDADGRADDRRVGAEAPAVRPVGEHHDGRRPRVVLVRVEEPPDLRIDPEHVEEVRGDEGGRHALWRPPARREMGGRPVGEGGERGEGRGLVPVIGVDRERLVRVVLVGLVGGHHANELLWALGVQRAEEHGVDHAEDGGRRADPERQGEDDEERGPGVAPDRAKGVPGDGGRGFRCRHARAPSDSVPGAVGGQGRRAQPVGAAPLSAPVRAWDAGFPQADGIQEVGRGSFARTRVRNRKRNSLPLLTGPGRRS